MGNKYDLEEKAAVLEFLPPAKPGDRLLDVGCGTGHWSRFFSSLGYEVVGVDISQSMILEVRNKCTARTRLMVANAASLPFDNASFKIVTAMATLEFVSNAESAIKEMIRCAKPAGRVIIGTLNKLAPINRDRIVKNKEPYASAHMFSPDELRNLMASFGAVRIRVSVNETKPKQVKPLREAWDRFALPWKQSAGAFIVAEVRR
ncbi:MAG: methyltransferase domain-containing protein [Deltaproteobacteria bacterium]|nr:methyltransferase domain-containing protein [Deltaproteobacteria bacterium]